MVDYTVQVIAQDQAKKYASRVERRLLFKLIKGELKSKTVFSKMALKITLSSILTAEIFNHF